MRWLIVTADDFGIASGINHGIIQAHRKGILTSTSLMVDRPACEEAAALGRYCRTLSVGIHLELDPDDAGRVHAELERQYARFLELIGAAPTHMDSITTCITTRESFFRCWSGRTGPECLCEAIRGPVIFRSSTANGVAKPISSR